MPEELGDFTSPERLRDLVNSLTENGKNNNRFENFALLNTSKWVLAGGFPKDCLRYYGYPSSQPVYVFIVEEDDDKFGVLELSLKALLKELRPVIEKHGQILLECDSVVRAAFFNLQREGAPFETMYSGDFYPFYMNELQKREILEKEFAASKGYEIGVVDVPNDHKFIHKMWPFGAFFRDDITKQRLDHLPSVCIRDSDGKVVSWELTHSTGAMTHLFTVEEHRGKGLGGLAENLLSQILVREGLHVFKYIVDSNFAVINATKRHPYWSQWKKLNDDDDADVVWSFNNFKFTG